METTLRYDAVKLEPPTDCDRLRHDVAATVAATVSDGRGTWSSSRCSEDDSCDATGSESGSQSHDDDSSAANSSVTTGHTAAARYTPRLTKSSDGLM